MANTNISKPLQNTINMFQDDVDGYVDALMAGSISADEFQSLMSTGLGQYSTVAFAQGQLSDELSMEARERVRNLVETQLGYLAGFTAVITAHQMANSMETYANRLRARAKSYTYSVKIPWAEGDVARQVGRLLPLPAMPCQGTQCGNNCGCEWRIVTLDEGKGDYNAWWERHKDDSCQTCLVRERLWNGPNGDGTTPVKIRGMQLQPIAGGGQAITTKQIVEVSPISPQAVYSLLDIYD